ncbi:MAG: hypothetical protein QOI34_1256, partial [Verrucomicrobiota bacterium]
PKRNGHPIVARDTGSASAWGECVSLNEEIERQQLALDCKRTITRIFSEDKREASIAFEEEAIGLSRKRDVVSNASRIHRNVTGEEWS